MLCSKFAGEVWPIDPENDQVSIEVKLGIVYCHRCRCQPQLHCHFLDLSSWFNAHVHVPKTLNARCLCLKADPSGKDEVLIA